MSNETLTGLFQRSERGRVGMKFRQPISLIERDHAFKTSPGRHVISTSVIQRGKDSEHRGLCRFIAELDVMFRGIVETAFGSGQVALVEKAFAKLAIGHRQPFFISDNPMMVEGLLERCDRLLPPSLTGFLQRQIVIENAERPIVVEIAQQIQRFKVVGAGFFRMVGADVEIAQIDQRVGDGMLIPFCALDREDFPITGFCLIQVARKGADVAQIAERVGDGPGVFGQAIIGDGLFICSLGLGQLPAVEKNARAMFIGVRHTEGLERNRKVCYRAARHDGSHELQKMWEGIYLSLL
jgi:hypothetical protein